MLPRGCHGVGHVLITSRQLSEASGASSLGYSSLGQLAACRAVVQVGGAEAYWLLVTGYYLLFTIYYLLVTRY